MEWQSASLAQCGMSHSESIIHSLFSHHYSMPGAVSSLVEVECRLVEMEC